mmetsp:Transcript_19676/g.23606  ORF Transcript_19676/g.23606 Transcript_19676/m.23606 type:complete len:256 (-) Transcript_19676:1305-2072(-)
MQHDSSQRYHLHLHPNITQQEHLISPPTHDPPPPFLPSPCPTRVADSRTRTNSPQTPKSQLYFSPPSSTPIPIRSQLLARENQTFRHATTPVTCSQLHFPFLPLPYLFARELVIKACQTDRERLQRRHRPLIVHRERVLANLSKLQNNTILVLVIHQLEVLHRGVSHTSVEVQTVSLHLFVPLRGLIPHHHQILRFTTLLVSLKNTISLLLRSKQESLILVIHLRNHNCHLPWSSCSKHVVLVQHRSQFCANCHL